MAERFIYFNDDHFLLTELGKEVFFDPSPVLRGKWVDLSEPAKPWLHRRKNAAEILGVPAERMFQEVHAPVPMSRSTLEELWREYHEAFLRNIAYRFRSPHAFHPITMHHNKLLRDGAVFENGAYPYLNTVTCAGHATIGTGAPVCGSG